MISVKCNGKRLFKCKKLFACTKHVGNFLERDENGNPATIVIKFNYYLASNKDISRASNGIEIPKLSEEQYEGIKNKLQSIDSGEIEIADLMSEFGVK